MVGLGDLAGGGFISDASATNSDGSVVVGFSSSANGTEAFRWTQAGGMAGLGDLDGGAFSSFAYATSSDGSVVIGFGTTAGGQEAFRWTQSGGLMGLGHLAGGTQSNAFDTNMMALSLSVMNVTAGGPEAFRWTQAGGMQRVTDWLAAAGVSTAAGYTLTNARGISRRWQRSGWFGRKP